MPPAVSPKVCVIGLDCATPELVFERWPHLLPNLRRFMQHGVHGPLESVIPPITVPAWMCMATGKDPGTLGIYGFRNRRDRSYDGLVFANSRMVREPALWDVLAEHGRRTVALGIPLTYPPRPIHGEMVTDFLAPDTNADYTYPPELKHEISDTVGDYILDTREFRTEDKARLLADIYAMTRQRFALAKYLAVNKPWDLFFMVEMGPDRIHHAFWKYMDPLHPKYQAGHPLEHAIRDYYVALDAEIGSFVSALAPQTHILIVSDHGAKRMDGGFCFNDWLIQEGYLVLKAVPEGVTKFAPALVDWERTRAWGDGGYYGRLFLNVRGREPQGVVAPSEIERLKTELTTQIESLTDEHGQPLGSRVFRPEAVYNRSENVPPDLIVYFGNLHWRSVGTVGNPSIWTHSNDTGPDDANHAQHGIFLMARVGDISSSFAEAESVSAAQVARPDLSLYDVAPTVLNLLDLPVPTGMGRHAVATGTWASSTDVYTPEEEAELARRLEDLGYL